MSTPYRALDLLTRGGYAPKVKGREPYWRPKAPACARLVHTPSWTWSSVSKTEAGNELIDLDVNAAFLAAIASADFAHGALEHTGTWDGGKPVPGYYLITVPAWNAQGICSPLGTAELGDVVWVAHPTLELLWQLSEDGILAAPVVHDAYTAAVRCRFRKWAERLRDDRAEYIDRRDAEVAGTPEHDQRQAEYTAFKNAYAQAVQMFLGKDDQASKSPVFRPDWYHTVHAQHAASTWRKAYRAWQAGCGPAAMGSVDEVTFTRTDWEDMAGMAQAPFRIDHTGKTLGSFKIKNVYVALESAS